MKMFSRFSRMLAGMRILAIDPGYDRLGIAVVEGNSSRPTLVISYCVSPEKGAHEKRLAHVSSAVTEAIEKYAPDALAIEISVFRDRPPFFLKVLKTTVVRPLLFVNFQNWLMRRVQPQSQLGFLFGGCMVGLHTGWSGRRANRNYIVKVGVG